MTDANRADVLSHFPGAVLKRDFPDTWTVWHENCLWGCGSTEADAWKDAKRSIERHEGRMAGGS